MLARMHESRERSASVDPVDVCALHMALLPEPNNDTKRGKQSCAGCQDGGWDFVPRALTGERTHRESECSENGL
jgi:hypothetical protein